MSSKLRKKTKKNDIASFEKLIQKADQRQEQQIKQIEQELRRTTQNTYIGMMYCIFTLVIRKMLGFGPVRTLRVLNEVAAVVNDLSDGTITVFDLKRDAEEVGIKVIFNEKYDIIECGIFEEDEYAAARKKIDEERMLLYESKKLKGLRLWTDPEFETK